ncbi:YfkD famly protein [Alkalihalobacillus sp. CinArs1]|uniref:YfkD famly protein n=1 Tax=Alkalihalobacillus sp. CinArs1 TaxID=2995314 RepID=UPI0022DDEB60|nr:YfkD famly protein [Alkalihalobacillus sp. CinArs1]
MKKIALMIILLTVILPMNAMAKEATQVSKKHAIQIPDSVVNISKENTYPNPTQDQPTLQPSELTRELIDSTDIKIENPQLIQILNDSHISPSKVAIGYRASIYLGKWPLMYDSQETNVNWQYKQANVNRYDNRGGKGTAKMSYRQEEEKSVSGGLTASIPSSDDVKKMMLMKASEKTKLSLAFQTIIGKGTRKTNVYNIAPLHYGTLSSYVPAVNEKGKVTYGEVYLVLKGSEKGIEVRNVTQQGIGAWIPVQDYLSFEFNTQK